MTVIKDYMISDLIIRSDILPLSFFEKSAYTGEKRGLRFRIEKTELEDEDKKTKFLTLYSWKGPFSFDNTDESEMKKTLHPFSDEGIEEIIEVLNGRFD